MAGLAYRSGRIESLFTSHDFFHWSLTRLLLASGRSHRTSFNEVLAQASSLGYPPPFRYAGRVPKWPKGTGCKPVGVRLRRFESSRAHC